MGGRAFGPPLCRGCAPATPPSKTIPHRPYVLIPAVRLQQRGCRQPDTQSNSLNGGSDKGLVKTDTVYGLVVTEKLRTDHQKPQFRIPTTPRPGQPPCSLFPSNVSSQQSLLPHPLSQSPNPCSSPAVPPQFPRSSAPPQRPPPKPSLTHLCAFFAAVRLSSSVPAVNQ